MLRNRINYVMGNEEGSQTLELIMIIGAVLIIGAVVLVFGDQVKNFMNKTNTKVGELTKRADVEIGVGSGL